MFCALIIICALKFVCACVAYLDISIKWIKFLLLKGTIFRHSKNQGGIYLHISLLTTKFVYQLLHDIQNQAINLVFLNISV